MVGIHLDYANTSLLPCGSRNRILGRFGMLCVYELPELAVHPNCHYCMYFDIVLCADRCRALVRWRAVCILEI